MQARHGDEVPLPGAAEAEAVGVRQRGAVAQDQGPGEPRVVRGETRVEDRRCAVSRRRPRARQRAAGRLQDDLQARPARSTHPVRWSPRRAQRRGLTRVAGIRRAARPRETGDGPDPVARAERAPVPAAEAQADAEAAARRRRRCGLHVDHERGARPVRGARRSRTRPSTSWTAGRSRAATSGRGARGRGRRRQEEAEQDAAPQRAARPVQRPGDQDRRGEQDRGGGSPGPRGAGPRRDRGRAAAGARGDGSTPCHRASGPGGHVRARAGNGRAGHEVAVSSPHDPPLPRDRSRRHRARARRARPAWRRASARPSTRRSRSCWAARAA